MKKIILLSIVILLFSGVYAKEKYSYEMYKNHKAVGASQSRPKNEVSDKVGEASHKCTCQ
jgi:hypothetical protein